MDIPMCLVIHHGGKWVEKPSFCYMGGNVKLINDLPTDFDPSYLKGLINSLGYNNIVKLHYCDPLKELHKGIRFLGYDGTTFGMFISLLYEFKMLDIFTEHDEGEVECLTQETVVSNTCKDVIVGQYEGSDNEDDEVREAREQLQEDKRREKSYEEEIDSLSSPHNSDGEGDCGYLLPQPGHDRKINKRKASVLSEVLSVEQECPFYLGQEFEDAIEFRGAITNYCMNIGRDTYYPKNDAKKIGVRCKADKCPFYVYASVVKGKAQLVVKTLVPQHNCGRLAVLKKIRASWIAKLYQQKFKINPYMKCQEIVDTLWAEKGVKASLWLALKARRKAQALILGEYKEQYGLLYRYAAEIKRSNPRNTIKFKMNSGVFERLYICFDAIKKGFLAGCRPFFGIDGCFLKGPFGGQLLVAVGRDGNNQMFPIAWACVEVEDTESWSWFLQLLADDLETVDGLGYTIMSDQQKGLLKAVSLVWPRADTRCCARHVYCNFRQVFGGGVQYRRGFWKIAKSTTEAEFEKNMSLFGDISKEAEADLRKRNQKKWVRAYFTTTPHCDCIDNNMNEVFNSYILSSRHKPIITMLEDIREGLMERLHKKRDYIANKEIQICPRIKSKLEKSKMDARGWLAFWDGHFSYGVREGLTQTRYVVSLLDKTCSCNAWQLSGVPCNHAVAAIWKAKEAPEHYVSHYFSKDTYLKAYLFPLEPLNGPQQWPQSS
ncbi:uncharacterized protein LOC125493779 [Beta vulgaris subsp. vulgaris]|uniref:uncharacterized protein LOC125493779 n=1 Tax=Beta vulgaris subsp. vulgaris TaxID=3555 RepID=UPI0025472D79|nr:uncharacterized protein LOC125493779 [Beta vulgaris subsp. vulgaris]